MGELVPNTRSLWARGGVHPGQVTSPSQGNTQTTKHTLITPKGNLERSINLTGMSLDCGRKLEYLVRTHACTGRACKLNAERPLDWNQTQNLLAARQQCYQLRHRAAQRRLLHKMKNIMENPEHPLHETVLQQQSVFSQRLLQICCHLPVKKMAAPDELFCWEGDWGLPSVSTDCLVVLAYAQFAGAPLKLRKICNPWRSPSGSLPALRTNQKKTLSRPSDIIIHLRKQKYNADYDLSAKEGADSLAFISLLEEKLIPALIYTFWIEPKNYVDVTRRWYAEHMMFPLNFFLPGRMQSRQLEKLRLLRGDENLEAGEELEKE
ncbi:hypothetical protein ATANTOWER_002422, partial [Ataeniobius toweri]|nr:hypothetical protein [Ataeniobius toweri]